MQNSLAEIRLRAEGRLGEMLAEMEKSPVQLYRGNMVSPREDIPTYDELGISKMQSHR